VGTSPERRAASGRRGNAASPNPGPNVLGTIPSGDWRSLTRTARKAPWLHAISVLRSQQSLAVQWPFTQEITGSNPVGVPFESAAIRTIPNLSSGLVDVGGQNEVYVGLLLWRSRRWWWFLTSDRRCARCSCQLVLNGGARATVTVHHRTYARFGRERRSDIELLRWHCHWGCGLVAAPAAGGRRTKRHGRRA
jgi:hypothetical protein